jgi:hypothetical protein
LKTMIDAILRREEFVVSPPVLLDIGASGAIHPKWKAVAKHSIGIAFDADVREMNYVVKESSGYRKLYVFNRLVTDKPSSESDFYLTRSPYCSSLLKPDQNSLHNWAFAELFEVDRMVKLKTAALPSILQEIGVNKIDWFKTDSQGTDLRLFVSLGEELIQKVLVAEFEPGIIDAYEGEDKLWSLLAFMDKYPFWMTSLDIKGSERIGRNSYHTRLSGLDRKLLPALLKTSPGWGEASYFNTFERDSSYLDKRDFLLGWVFAVIEKQYGFALELAVKGSHRYNDPVFDELADFALTKIKRGYVSLPLYIINKMFHRLMRSIL